MKMNSKENNILDKLTFNILEYQQLRLHERDCGDNACRHGGRFLRAGQKGQAGNGAAGRHFLGAGRLVTNTMDDTLTPLTMLLASV